MNGHGSSGTVLRNRRKLLAGASLWECLPCCRCTCGQTVSVWGSGKMPDWILKKQVGTLNREETDFLCFPGVFNIHTQSKTVSCAHPPRRLHHFSGHIEWATPFQNNNNSNNNNNNIKAELQSPDYWVVCV